LRDTRSGRIDQLEQPAALKIGPHGRGNDARHGWITGEIGNRHRNAVGTGTGDLDRKLRLGNGRFGLVST
jgi:hypothetical protein